MLEIINTFFQTVVLGVTSVFVFLGIAPHDSTLFYIRDDETPSVKDIALEEVGGLRKEEKTSSSSTPPLPQQEKPENPSITKTIDSEKSTETMSKDLETEVSMKSVDTNIHQNTLEGSVVNELVRGAVVNIFCLSKNTGVFNPISASGVVVDERGVILTNAHVAQYLLLDTYQERDLMSCVIRTGSPAQVAYRATPLYISHSWIDEHAEEIDKQNMGGATGENDFAFLYITSPTNTKNELPDSFPHLTIYPLDTPLYESDPVMVGAYPAGFLGGVTITKDLWMSTSITSITKLFTFSTEGYKPLDLITVENVVAAQEGSSGGAVVSMKNAQLIGIIVTRGEGETTSERKLGALTLKHINRVLHRETNGGIAELLGGSLEKKASLYASTTAPLLKERLLSALKN